MFDIPDGASATDIQSILFSEYLDALVAAIDGKDCVLVGGAVTAQGTPDMTVAVAKASVLTNGVLKPVTAGNATITAAHGTLPRLDLVVADSTGAKQVRAGTAAAAPKPPARTANDVLLAVVYVPAADTTIGASQIVDLRVMRTQGPITVDKVTTPVVFNTTLAVQTYYSLTLPSGLLLAGKILRVRLEGTSLMNSGAPTLTYSISYGGTVLFADTTGAFTLSALRRTWRLDLALAAQGTSDQQLTGLWWNGVTGAPVAPTTGVGDATAGSSGGGAGSAAVDSDAADRVFLVEITMSVSNVAVEMALEFAEAVLS